MKSLQFPLNQANSTKKISKIAKNHGRRTSTAEKSSKDPSQKFQETLQATLSTATGNKDLNTHPSNLAQTASFIQQKSTPKPKKNYPKVSTNQAEP